MSVKGDWTLACRWWQLCPGWRSRVGPWPQRSEGRECSRRVRGGMVRPAGQAGHVTPLASGTS